MGWDEPTFPGVPALYLVPIQFPVLTITCVKGYGRLFDRYLPHQLSLLFEEVCKNVPSRNLKFPTSQAMPSVALSRTAAICSLTQADQLAA